MEAKIEDELKKRTRGWKVETYNLEGIYRNEELEGKKWS